MKKKWTIGRPGIGGECLEFAPSPPHMVEEGRYGISRVKRMSGDRNETRTLMVAPLPAGTMLTDLADVVESIVGEEGRRGMSGLLDHRGISGKLPTLRERFASLAGAANPNPSLTELAAATLLLAMGEEAVFWSGADDDELKGHDRQAVRAETERLIALFRLIAGQAPD